MIRHQAVLLLGPTGSGKTPLGDWLQDLGLWGRRCHHFDFGAGLREIAAAHASAGFTAREMRYIQDVVEKGTLLENETFYLASKILGNFILRRQVHPRDLLVMNGLPRHIGQAEALSEMLQFVAIVHLECSAETVWERLQSNAGDRKSVV
jgi:adenylate kinase family enzyme